MKTKSRKYTRFIAGLAAIMCVGMLANCSNSSYNDKGANDKPVSEWTDAELRDLSVRDYIATNGVVCSANPYASKAGLDVLQAGGNAYDAAVAVSFALGVVEPNASGIGGGGIMVSYDATKGEYNCYNFREFAAASTDPSRLVLSKTSAVPNHVSGMITIHENHGVLTRQQVLAPAINYAENGFTLTSRNGSYMGTIFNTTKGDKAINPDYRTVFGNDKGIRAKKSGELLVQTDYANVLKAISENGKDGFYDGWVADAIVESQTENMQCIKAGTYAGIAYAKGEFMKRAVWETLSETEKACFNTGFITKADLTYAKENFPKKVDPIVGTFEGYDVITSNAPSSGGIILIEALNMLEHYDNHAEPGKKLKELGHNTPEYLNAVSTAISASYGDRVKYFGDPEFTDVPLLGLTSKAYAADRWDQIFTAGQAWKGSLGGGTDYGQPWDYEYDIREHATYSGEDYSQTESTTTFSVADKDGNIVTVTQTINSAFGNCVIPYGCGFAMNNEMGDFSGSSTSSNYVQPMKHPQSNMMPTIVMKDGNPWATFGSPGGATIPSTVTQVALNLMVFDMDIQSAIVAKRVDAYTPGSSSTTVYVCQTAGTYGGKEYQVGDPINSATYTGLTDAEKESWKSEKRYTLSYEKIGNDNIEGLRAMGYWFDDSGSTTIGSVQGIRFNRENGTIHAGADNRRDGKSLGY